MISDLSRVDNVITVHGTFGDDVIPTQMEQRIINPDLVDVIGKRDVRALPGPLVPAPKGGYSSGMTYDADLGTFTATYEFDTPEGATTAAAADLGERAMSWQVEDADANRQGLTIAEFGELGGPGMGGCPAGPADQAAPVGTASAQRSGDRAVVKWTAPTPQPGADAVTGYSVEAVGTTGANGEAPVLGLRTGPGATQTTLTGLDPTADYTFEVRSLSGAKASVPFTMAKPTNPDTTQPTLSLSPPPSTDGSAVLADEVAVDSNGQVWFTTDGTPVVSGGLPSDSAQFYAGPIPITGPTDLRVVSFDAVGNMQGPVQGQYDVTPPPAAPAAPTGLVSTSKGQDRVALTWDDAGPTVSGWQVTVYDATGQTPLASQPPVTTVPRQTVTGLRPGTGYQFAVRAKGPGRTSPESARITVTTDAATDQVTISSGRWKSTEFRVVGTGTLIGASIQLHQVKTDGTPGAAIAGAVAPVVAGAVPGVGDWEVRLRNGATPPNPGRVIAVSNGGGQSAPFTLR